MAVVALLGLTALVFSNALGTRWTAGRAQHLAEIEEAITHSSLAQAHLGQAMLLAVDLEAGLTTQPVLTAAIDEARRSLGATLLHTETAGRENAALLEDVEEYAGAGFAVLEALENGDLESAENLAQDGIDDTHLRLAAGLAELRDARLGDIAQAESAAGMMAAFAGFLLALGLPLTMVAAYRLLAARQLRRKEAESRRLAHDALIDAKDQFIANVSHELRTPLTGIYGFARVLEDGGLFDPETGLELLNLIIGQAGELSRMVDDLLAAARLDAGLLSFHTQSIELPQALDEVLPSFNRFGTPVEVDCPPAAVMADPIRLRQVLRNLVANARNHGGPNVRIVGTVRDEALSLAVVDDGKGVPPDLQPRLFKRFIHLADEPLLVGSVGLGLYIARVLAVGMGGDLRYERRDGESHFTLELELTTADRAEAGVEEHA